MTFFSRHTLDAHIRFKLNSCKTVSTTPTSLFMSPYTVHLTKFSPLPTRIALKNFFVSERGTSEPNNPLGSALIVQPEHIISGKWQYTAVTLYTKQMAINRQPQRS